MYGRRLQFFFRARQSAIKLDNFRASEMEQKFYAISNISKEELRGSVNCTIILYRREIILG